MDLDKFILELAAVGAPMPEYAHATYMKAPIGSRAEQMARERCDELILALLPSVTDLRRVRRFASLAFYEATEAAAFARLEELIIDELDHATLSRARKLYDIAPLGSRAEHRAREVYTRLERERDNPPIEK